MVRCGPALARLRRDRIERAAQGSDFDLRLAVDTADGRHVTVGHDTDPTEEEIDLLSRQVDELGIAAWLAIQAGDYHDPEAALELMEVRRIGRREGNWEQARAAFLAIRRQMNGDV